VNVVDDDSTIEVPGSYLEWWRAYKPLSYGDRLTVTQAGLGPVTGIDPGLAACAIAYGRYARRSSVFAPLFTVLLLAGMSVVLDRPSLRRVGLLVGVAVVMTVFCIGVCARSRRAEQVNRDTIAAAGQ
jgi:hypothetical protein